MKDKEETANTAYFLGHRDGRDFSLHFLSYVMTVEVRDYITYFKKTVTATGYGSKCL